MRVLPFVALVIALTPGASLMAREAETVVPFGRDALTNIASGVDIKAGREIVALVRLAYDRENLYAQFNVRDTSPLTNSGGNTQLLFKTGDSVDIQIGLARGAGTPKSAPVAGDIRVLMTRIESGPIAMAYRYVVPGGGKPVVFGSPTGHTDVDCVEALQNAVVSTEITGHAYTLTAVLPWRSLAGGDYVPIPGRAMYGDVGILLSDPDGGITVERLYWSNKLTTIVADVPTEARIEPAHWGVFILGKDGRQPASGKH